MEYRSVSRIVLFVIIVSPVSKKDASNFEASLFDKEATIMIPVNGKRVNYIKLDPIFYLSEAHPYSSKNIKQPERIVCSVCNKVNPKKSLKCEFCSLFTCLECSPKTYPFPLVEADSLKGVICLICEAKLHINAVSAFLLLQFVDNILL